MSYRRCVLRRREMTTIMPRLASKMLNKVRWSKTIMG
jgi:hypothetical protein